ncbi:hypothetical protein [Bradyrhizobium sp. ORS 375]|uniref:hypothetical protein n=1 Tax=Bradyrhizobium sp. (strain ORS 375) TaxID=566679 RepID=UPI000A012D33|nr:hypothetical protein [Bradyrhizobium sp. ORS 375]
MSEHRRETPDRTSGKPADPNTSKDQPPPAGPHARPDLVDEDKTPGTGMLPDPHDSNPSPTG